MSSPLPSFSDLYISKTMHSTRSGQVYSHQFLRGKAPAGDSDSDNDSNHSIDSDNDNEDEEQDMEGIERGSQEFDVFLSDEESEEDESNESLHTVLAVDHCRLVRPRRQSQGQLTPYFAFQVGVAEVKPVSIRISSLRRGGEEKCSCAIEPCFHIIRLKSAMGISAGDDCYERLDERGMSNVCDELEWDFSDEPYLFPAPQWTLRNERLRTSSTSRRREGDVRDMLSYFHPHAVADEYRDIFDFAVHNDDVLVPCNLEATLAKLLTQDDVIFHRFEQHFPRESRDMLYLHKMEDKFQESLQQLDEYADSGNLSNWNAMAPSDNAVFEHNVPWCAQTLIHVSDSMRDNLKWRVGMSRHNQLQAAAILVRMLEAVRMRNVDAYPNHSFRRNRPHGEQLTNRNLYLNLLGPQSEDIPGRSDFIIDALETLPGNVVAASDFVDRLDRLRADLSSIAFVSPRRLFVNRLGQLVSKLRANYGLPVVSISSSMPATSAFGADLNTSYSVGSSSSSYAIAGPSSLGGPSSSSRARLGSSTRSTLGKRSGRSASSSDRRGKRAMK
ncbi:hypothetical protein SBOR_1366 [Sclerotinia borealis F-4128]|uniref:SWIM-type domain-containing protein n=1 Tax=Sclerotinia borealis (strain F-4128) TaxID=1432307 RepID=W9CUR3_SCLBF|nr:hypothetical protein SBOR_1366 [Sclerotinia borealis F-4128]